MKDQQQINSLFDKYLSGECSAQEVQELMNYFNAEQSEVLQDRILREFEGLTFQNENEVALPDRVFEKIKARIGQVSPEKAPKLLWTRWIAAAAILIIVGLGFYFYKPISVGEQQSVYLNDIDPGKDGATLTLANGQKILIKDALAGNIATQAGVKISKTADGQIVYELTSDNVDASQYNTITTSRGEQTQVRLPDGSVVFLNAASSLRFPTSFAKLKERRVELSGEGYFEVAKDKAHPFIVKSDQQQIEVLGTHFNVSAYKDEQTVKTTLLEGSVRIASGQSKVVLRPGEQALNVSEKLSVTQVDADKAIAWKNSKFVFEDENIESIMRKLSRWYNVEVVYQDNVSDRTFTGSISRYDKISKILDKISYIEAVKFKIEGRRIIVMK